MKTQFLVVALIVLGLVGTGTILLITNHYASVSCPTPVGTVRPGETPEAAAARLGGTFSTPDKYIPRIF